MRKCVALVVLLTLVAPAPVRAQAPGGFVPPVEGAIVRHFDPPAGAYGPGHRGVDFDVSAGTLVAAAAPGTVTFAGRVAGRLAVSIRHGSELTTTYSELAEISIERGMEVAAGAWIGRTGVAHTKTGGLHFGVKHKGIYVDPAVMLGPLDLGGALRLTPLLWEPSKEIPEALADALAPTGPGTNTRRCTGLRSRSTIARAPNDNIAVAVAGIASKTEGRDAADMYDPGPRFFGYEPERTYFFSYRGPRGRRLHADYPRSDTYRDIDQSADQLDRLVRAIGRRHPGADVDLIAHSQGGIVARTYLTRRAAGDFAGGPRVEHLVTLAAPHTGAPAAGNVGHLQDHTALGPPLLGMAHERALAGWPVPDPLSRAVAQLAPGSGLMRSLAAQDVTFGTRVLTLGIPNDLVVPADRTTMPGDLHRVVPPRGSIRLFGLPVLPTNGHSALVTSPATRVLVHDFLRGAAPACVTAWDTWGRRAGRAVSWAESRLGAVMSHIEGEPGRLLRTVGQLLAGSSQR